MLVELRKSLEGLEAGARCQHFLQQLGAHFQLERVGILGRRVGDVAILCAQNLKSEHLEMLGSGSQSCAPGEFLERTMDSASRGEVCSGVVNSSYMATHSISVKMVAMALVRCPQDERFLYVDRASQAGPFSPAELDLLVRCAQLVDSLQLELG